MAGNHEFNKPGSAFTEGRDEKGLFVAGNALRKGEFLVEPDEFYRIGMEFCDECEALKKTPTIAALCRKLGVTPVTLYNYEKRDEFSFEVHAVRLRIVEVWEARLIGSGTAGAQFWLRNNAGYKDTRQTELSGPNGGPVETVTSVEVVGVMPAGVTLDPDAL